MIQTDRAYISKQTEHRDLIRRMKIGFAMIRTSTHKKALAGIYLAGALLAWLFRAHLFRLDMYGMFSPVLEAVINLILPLYLILGFLALLVFLGTPCGGKSARIGLQKAGLVNHMGEAPVLISKCQDTANPKSTIWEFDPCGIPVSEWEEKQVKIEAALNVSIAKIAWKNGRKTICIYTLPAENELPALLPWKRQYLSQDSFVLVLGESLLDRVTINLAHVPHILLGGSTGSGKSGLLKLLLMQALCKGAEVYIADFKGGVDFPKVWHQKCHLCFSEQELLDILSQLTEALEDRKRIFAENGYANIDEYIKVMGQPLPRLFFACDEVAEVLDKTGRSKEEKELINQIENRLSKIARLGRAFGIHLILATQRPDANILPGQIKNNLDCRICGRADNVLSQIILDNTSAADEIPKDAQGRFITNTGVIFQAYWFEDSSL